MADISFISILKTNGRYKYQADYTIFLSQDDALVLLSFPIAACRADHLALNQCS